MIPNSFEVSAIIALLLSASPRLWKLLSYFYDCFFIHYSKLALITFYHNFSVILNPYPLFYHQRLDLRISRNTLSVGIE